LTDDQEDKRIEIGQKLFANANSSEKFLKNIIRGDETGFMVMMLKPKYNSLSGWGKGLLDHKKKHG